MYKMQQNFTHSSLENVYLLGEGVKNREKTSSVFELPA